MKIFLKFTVTVKKIASFAFNPRFRTHFLVKMDHQGQFWKIQVLRSSKLSLDAKIDEILAEIFEVKVASSYTKILQKWYSVDHWNCKNSRKSMEFEFFFESDTSQRCHVDMTWYSLRRYRRKSRMTQYFFHLEWFKGCNFSYDLMKRRQLWAQISWPKIHQFWYPGTVLNSSEPEFFKTVLSDPFWPRNVSEILG